MKTTIQNEDGKLVAILEGRLDTEASATTERDLQPLQEAKNSKIVLDCTNLEYISSSGLRIFLSLLKATRANSSEIYLKNINPQIRDVFTMTGFVNLFNII